MKWYVAGGDVKSMYHAIKEKTPLIGIGHPGESSADFFRVEYEMNYMLDQSAIPQVCQRLSDVLFHWPHGLT